MYYGIVLVLFTVFAIKGQKLELDRGPTAPPEACLFCLVVLLVLKSLDSQLSVSAAKVASCSFEIDVVLKWLLKD